MNRHISYFCGNQENQQNYFTLVCDNQETITLVHTSCDNKKQLFLRQTNAKAFSYK